MEDFESYTTNKKSFKEKLKIIGPGAIVTASFIGPGTVTTATRAGASFGYAILWAVVFSIITTIVLQLMVSRLGIITQEGLGEAIREQFSNPIIKFCAVWLVVISIGVGCAAYISGDLLGTSLGISTLTGMSENVIAPIVGVIILFFGLSGSYKLIERVMVFLIVIMGITFITTMFVAQPDWGSVFKGAFVPTMPSGSIIMIIAVIGTTVVPYNFFIHASTAHEKWKDPAHIKEARWDTIISISVGGFITAAILITSATMIKGIDVKSAAELSLQLEPVLGSWAKGFIAIGLFAAGLSSATASPLGAAVTMASVFKWKDGIKDKRFKIVFAAIIVIGIITSALGFEPMDVLLFAQALNGILLPVISILLLIVMNNRRRLGKYVNIPRPAPRPQPKNRRHPRAPQPRSRRPRPPSPRHRPNRPRSPHRPRHRQPPSRPHRARPMLFPRRPPTGRTRRRSRPAPTTMNPHARACRGSA